MSSEEQTRFLDRIDTGFKNVDKAFEKVDKSFEKMNENIEHLKENATVTSTTIWGTNNQGGMKREQEEIKVEQEKHKKFIMGAYAIISAIGMVIGILEFILHATSKH